MNKENQLKSFLVTVVVILIVFLFWKWILILLLFLLLIIIAVIAYLVYKFRRSVKVVNVGSTRNDYDDKKEFRNPYEKEQTTKTETKSADKVKTSGKVMEAEYTIVSDVENE